MKNDKTEFLNYIHSFRGLAILLILFGHAMVAAFIGAKGSFDDSHPLLIVSEVFYHDSTLYFALISGILFSRVLKKRGYRRFYKSKVKNIILPYIFISVVFTLLKNKFNTGILDGIWGFTKTIFENLIYGKANFVLWYIPVLIFLYLTTPLLDYLSDKQPVKKGLYVIIILLPLVVSRVPIDLEYSLHLPTMIYFTGAYALGIYLGKDLEYGFKQIAVFKTYIIIVAVLSTLVLFYLYINNLNLVGSVSLKESVFYIQKIAFALLIMLFLKNKLNRPLRSLNGVARDSFSIYFLHGYILYASLPLFKFILNITEIAPLNIIITTAVLIVYTLVVCRFIIWVFKRVFGKKSRVLIGA